MLEHTLDITTRAGAMETFVCRPERGGPFPPVFMLMDAPGIREELRDMARRLATVGYYVLLPNLYYRAGRDVCSSSILRLSAHCGLRFFASNSALNSRVTKRRRAINSACNSSIVAVILGFLLAG